MSSSSSSTTIGKTHDYYLRLALQEAKKSPPKPTNFCVGAILVSGDEILSSGYTLELPGNTHAEQCALTNLVESVRKDSGDSNKTEGEILNERLGTEMKTVLYTTMEPCSIRLSGNDSGVARIIGTRSPDSTRGIRKVVFGAKEPGDFVKDSKSCAMLDEAGVEWEYARDPGLETEILRVAKAGHGTKLEERPAGIQANPKKRMMEL